MACRLLRYSSRDVVEGIEHYAESLLLHLTQGRCDFWARRSETGAIDCIMGP